MMKNTNKWCQTPPSVTVRVKPSTLQPLQGRRGQRLKRANGQEAQGPPGKSQASHCRPETYYPPTTVPPTIIIQQQEMAAFFRVFDDDLVYDFLLRDYCYKMTDKYLLAMTFVYFKRARFTIAEYTTKNLFIALYLANTMEEDEEENKYEIFPWALGKNWATQFPRFIRQRDKLWARIDFRAAVSRRCCEEVMAIVPTHFVWQRNRSEHHGFAQRQYGDQSQISFPRGPSASPVFCALCNQGSSLDQGSSFVLPSRGPSAHIPNPTIPHPLTSALQMEFTPPRPAASLRKHVRNNHQQFSCCCAQEAPGDESSCGSTYDTSMDWINEE